MPQWIINPYNTAAIEEANVMMQKELITISTDEELKQKFNQGYQKFWLQRNIETQFPGTCSIPHKKIENPDEDADEAEKIRKELLIETEDRDELERQRSMDEFKDDHRRGWGNRANRS